jgi:transcriptional regulator with XRE-family HTH domain
MINHYDYTDISVRFKEVRNKSGLTQKKFGEIVELSSPAVSAIENGAYTPSFAVLRKMRKHLDLDYNWFIDGEGKEKDQKKDAKNKEILIANLRKEIDRLTKIIDNLHLNKWT